MEISQKKVSLILQQSESYRGKRIAKLLSAQTTKFLRKHSYRFDRANIIF